MLTPEKSEKTKNFFDWSPVFLRCLTEKGNVSEAAKEANVSRTIVYRHRSNNDRFKKAWDDALAQAADVLEAEAWRRAVEGVEEPVGWYQGKPGGTVTRYSDTLLIFLLKAHKPDKFRENISVSQSGEFVIKVKYGDRSGSPEKAPPKTD
jgi:hypothetical protein